MVKIFLNVVRQQAVEAMKIIEGDSIEYLLSEKQLALWQWINAGNNIYRTNHADRPI